MQVFLRLNDLVVVRHEIKQGRKPFEQLQDERRNPPGHTGWEHTFWMYRKSDETHTFPGDVGAFMSCKTGLNALNINIFTFLTSISKLINRIVDDNLYPMKRFYLCKVILASVRNAEMFRLFSWSWFPIFVHWEIGKSNTTFNGSSTFNDCS